MDTALLTPPAPAFIRLLARVLDTPADDPGCTLLERLAQWLDWTRALALARALELPLAELGDGAAPAVDEACLRQRQALHAGIVDDAAWPPPEPDYAPLRAHYLAQQRKLQAATGYLRGQLRDQLAQGSPAQRRLVELDAALEGALSPREQTLLTAIPGLLGKRHAQLLAQGGDGLTRFRGDLRSVLLAELELRFLPIDALRAALHTQGS